MRKTSWLVLSATALSCAQFGSTDVAPPPDDGGSPIPDGGVDAMQVEGGRPVLDAGSDGAASGCGLVAFDDDFERVTPLAGPWTAAARVYGDQDTIVMNTSDAQYASGARSLFVQASPTNDTAGHGQYLRKQLVASGTATPTCVEIHFALFVAKLAPTCCVNVQVLELSTSNITIGFGPSQLHVNEQDTSVMPAREHTLANLPVSTSKWIHLALRYDESAGKPTFGMMVDDLPVQLDALQFAHHGVGFLGTGLVYAPYDATAAFYVDDFHAR